jgi:acetyl-CoA carboxylase carboxyltransferase component
VSVIGGSSAAEVVLTQQVRTRARELQANSPESDPADTMRIAQASVGEEFDATHSVGRALEMGSVDQVISPERLRPSVITELLAPVTGPWRQPADRHVQHA